MTFVSSVFQFSMLKDLLHLQTSIRLDMQTNRKSAQQTIRLTDLLPSTYLLYFLCIVTFYSCSTEPKVNTTNIQEDSALDSNRLEESIQYIVQSDGEAIEVDGIRLTPVATERPYPNAHLHMSPLLNPKAGSNRFEFDIENFELGVQTEGERSRILANSEQGQHVHFIHNNGPYSAHYENSFDKTLNEGNNVVLAFLSRSYHESLKNSKAFIFQNIVIGDDAFPFDESAPHLIYSRPKGTYKNNVNKPILLDFLSDQYSHFGKWKSGESHYRRSRVYDQLMAALHCRRLGCWRA